MAVEPPGTRLAPISLTVIVGLACLVTVLVAGFVVLGLAGRDTAAYTLFLAGPLITSIVGAVLARRVHIVEEVARVIEAQTDGLLTAQIAQVHEHLDDQDAKEVSKAAGLRGEQVPVQRSKGFLETQKDSSRG